LRSFFTILVVLVTLPASAQQRTWYVLSREEGCVEPKYLVDLGMVSRAPVFPEDYAQMMRPLGKKTTFVFPPGFPSAFNGKVVQVKVGSEEGGVAFANDEVCRNIRR
jgi:hypothetical protein